jgi:sulfatase modifying factor 1
MKTLSQLAGDYFPGERVVIKGKKVTFPFRYCPPGYYKMGSPLSECGRARDEKQVSVSISKGFFLGETPVTQTQWRSIMGFNPSHFIGPNRPVDQVSWKDTQDFLSRARVLIKVSNEWMLNLPTEAQWEYACRAGTSTPWNTGNILTPADANFCESGIYRTCDVGSFAPNSWGLHDMHGNVWELCQDRYAMKLRGGIDPCGPKSGALRTAKGGSWRFGAELCRSACRSDITPGCRYALVGFRLAITQ